MPENSVTTLYTQALDALLDVAKSYYQRGKIAQSIALLENLLQIAELEDVTPEKRIEVLNRYGGMQMMQASLVDGNFEPPRQTFAQAQQLAEAGGFERLLSEAIDLDGFTQYFIGLNGNREAFVPALETLQRAYDIRRSIDDPLGLCHSLFHLGLVYENTEREEEAVKAYSESLAIARDHDFRVEQSYTTRHLGFVAQRNGDLERALTYLQDIFGATPGNRFSDFRTLIAGCGGRVLEALGRDDEAREMYQQARDRQKEIGLKRVSMVTLATWGTFLQKQDELDEAKQVLEEAYQYAKAINHTHGMAEISQSLKEITDQLNKITLPGEIVLTMD